MIETLWNYFAKATRQTFTHVALNSKYMISQMNLVPRHMAVTRIHSHITVSVAISKVYFHELVRIKSVWRSSSSSVEA